MTKLISAAVMASVLMMAAAYAATFTMDEKFLTPPRGMATIGDSHGDIAVSPVGEIYVSVQGGDRAGIQVYSAAGRYLRNVPGGPPDLHGFIIARAPNGTPNIYGVSRLAQKIVQLTLDGRVVLDEVVAVLPPVQVLPAAAEVVVQILGGAGQALIRQSPAL